jgi:hypothetical protein
LKNGRISGNLVEKRSILVQVNDFINSVCSEDGAITLLIVLLASGLLVIFRFLRPTAKRAFFPIALTLGVAGMQSLIFLDLGACPVYFVLLTLQIIGLCFVLTQVWVCPKCGAVVGNQAGAKEVHICSAQRNSYSHERDIPD